MGLTASSTGRKAVDHGMVIPKDGEKTRVIALAGNPNVGKSTVFNALTGMNQHTGNWSGKTVSSAWGRCRHGEEEFIVVDLPGTYSLMAHSAEEESARDFICFGEADAIAVVCDATCLERNLNLVLQILEVTRRVVVCVNLMDEAERKGIRLDLPRLEKLLGTPVVGTSGRSRQGLEELMDALARVAAGGEGPAKGSSPIWYGKAIEDAVEQLGSVVRSMTGGRPDSRWHALKLLEGDEAACRGADQSAGFPVSGMPEVSDARQAALDRLRSLGFTREKFRDRVAAAVVERSSEISAQVTEAGEGGPSPLDRRLDRILTSRRTGIPVMLLLLCGVFWLTIEGANIPSQFLSRLLFGIQDWLSALFRLAGAPEWLHGILVLGAYRVLAWVVSVMLPPMAIFFPLFTLLEDFGYLPRVAFNLDHCFKKVCACGKQALTMAMGFGCNAAGVVGCRIIDSPRERLIATITNNFVPCNGRLPLPQLWQITTRKTEPVQKNRPGRRQASSGTVLVFQQAAEKNRLALRGDPSRVQAALDSLEEELMGLFLQFRRNMAAGDDNIFGLIFFHPHYPLPQGYEGGKLSYALGKGEKGGMLAMAQADGRGDKRGLQEPGRNLAGREGKRNGHPRRLVLIRCPRGKAPWKGECLYKIPSVLLGAGLHTGHGSCP